MFVNTKRNKDVLFRTNVYKTSGEFFVRALFFLHTRVEHSVVRGLKHLDRVSDAQHGGQHV